MTRWVWGLCALLAPQMALATTCQNLTLDEGSFTVCEVAADEDLRLFHQGPQGPFANFAALQGFLAEQGKTLRFAMNAGMFDEALAPVGLYVESGVERKRLVTRDGPGNFGLLPNGVFCMSQAGDSGPTFQILESRAFAALRPACWMATQSGPLLVIDGRLHPAFLQTSTSRNYRNGVGVSDDGSMAYFAISNDEVNFHSFARLFRDELGLNWALFLDGSISRLFAPDLGRNDLGFPLGPIVGVVVDAESSKDE